AANLIKSELDKFADWILSYVPEPIKKTVKEAADKRVERLKERIKRLHEEVEDRFTPKEQQTALKGCLNSFRCKQSLEKHSECCGNHEAVGIEMPKIDKDGNLPHIKFKNYNRKMRVPFVVYADFESFTENIDTCSPDGSKSFTKQYQKHKPSGFCYLIKCFDGDISPPELV
ncbi:predicted protein, partial [Nematostella vectensis]